MTDVQARQLMAQPIDLGDGIVLTPAGPVQQIATGHLGGEYEVSGTPSAFAGTVDVRVTQSGLGVAFILLSPPDAVEPQQEALRELAFSLGVGERMTPGPAGGGRNDAWGPRLRGLYLARYFTGGFGGGASGAAVGSSEGRWSATGVGEQGTLVLNWASGEQTSLDLSYDYDQNRLYVDGSRMLRGHNEYCP